MPKSIICIHPAIGIARVGNSQDFFIGPEIPGIHPSVKTYRDKEGKLKRQAARFYLFQHKGKQQREITLKAKNVRCIAWTVHLKNKKAAALRFSGVMETQKTYRNARVKDRDTLILDSKPLKICGRNAELEATCDSFMSRPFRPPLKLCTLRTDSKGHLLVLGGHGRAGSLTGAGLKEKNGNDFANHDGWYDDTSDGSVEAVVTFADGSKVTARPSWVIVAPPKYAPALQSITTLYDTLYQKAIDDGREKNPFPELSKKKKAPFEPSFHRDIYPILRRAIELRWVYSKMAVGHENQFSIARAVKDEEYRRHIFQQFRIPSALPNKPGTGLGSMPYLWSDIFPYPVNGTVTKHQYEILNAWADGEFESISKSKTSSQRDICPEGLDRAALEACVGAAFYPGIECSFHMRDKFRYMRHRKIKGQDKEQYRDLFRLDPEHVHPGDVTEQMSIPWQSDFVDCSDGDEPFVWWPAQRPIDVLLREGHKEPYPTKRWARNFETEDLDLTAWGMIKNWHRLGFVEQSQGRFFETSRIK